MDLPLLYIVLGALTFCIGVLTTSKANRYLQKLTPAGGIPRDFFLDKCKTVYTAGSLLWGPALYFGAFAFYLTLHPERIAFALFCIGALYITRSFFIILTPFSKHPKIVVPDTKSLATELTYLGDDFFFSGHVSIPLMMGLITLGSPGWPLFFFVCAIGMAFGVILEHTHYSIDVFSTPFFAFGVYQFCLFVVEKGTPVLTNILS